MPHNNDCDIGQLCFHFFTRTCSVFANKHTIIFVVRKFKQSSGGTGRVTAESRERTSVYH